ncbi:MAG: sorbosone dehydrogenase family protein, partial [Acidimicrobiia bacterium]
TPTGRGYWLVAADGGVFSFGDAQFFGSTGSLRLNQPIVAMSSDPSGLGYRFVASDGGVFNFGAPSFGSGVGRVSDSVVAMAARPQGDGYWLTTDRGDVVALGAATALGSLGADLDSLRVSVNPAFTGLSAPTAMVTKPGTRDMYVTEKAGRVRVIRDGVLDPTPVLTIDPSLITAAGERGLLSMTFNADGSRVYLLRTAADGDVMVEEYMTTAGSFVGASRRTVLTAEHSTYPNHNGGHLVWGPDGHLWISIGDGGGAGDPLGNGQNTGTFLGKVLRIDPLPSGASPYTIPADNPFVGQSGKAPEVVAYGLRNPWRFTFDRLTGDLWIADVGQGSREEIDLDTAPVTLGTNYGWPLYEGSQRYSGNNPSGAALPIFDYPHANGDCSISGGVVYRGTAMPKADGVYFYGDFCTGRIGALRQRDAVAVDHVGSIANVASIVSFTQGVDDALYAVSSSGTIWRLTVG